MDVRNHNISRTDIKAMKASARRPEVVDIALALKAKHPLWSWEKCTTQAKHQVTTRGLR